MGELFGIIHVICFLSLFVLFVYYYILLVNEIMLPGLNLYIFNHPCAFLYTCWLFLYIGYRPSSFHIR
jgi:hypothetical protein